MKSLIWGFAAFALAGLFSGAAVHAGSPPALGIEEKLGQTAAMDTLLKDEDGRAVTLASIVDKPTILTLNFYRCAGICTPQLNGLVDVLDKVDMQPGKDFQVVTVSFDPKDTPEMAAMKRQNYISQLKRPFPPSAWRFLTGEGAQTKRLADSVGFYFKPDGDQFLHAAALMYLSPQGKIVRYSYGIQYLPFDMKMALNEAAAGRPGATIQKALLFCYSYDPGGKRYVLSVTRIAAVATFVFLIGFLVFLAVKRKKIDAPGSAS
jgi:protein SCO1/2